jgi:hypothetical protein
MKWWIFCAGLAYLSACLPLDGQTDDEEAFLENREESDATGWLDLFENLRKDPIDLNRASFEVLQSLPLISPAFARRVMDERKNNGPFNNWTDFIRRLYLNASYARVLQPYFQISDLKETGTRRVDLRHRLSQSFPKSEGYRSGAYSGGPLHVYTRVKIQWGNRMSAGFLSEKDPGESRWNDHWVGFVEIRSTDGTYRVILGHFFMESGRGLVFWNPFGMAMGKDPLAPIRIRPRGVGGYLYAAEQKALQGAAIQKSLRFLQCTLLGSTSRLDGTVNPDGTIRGLSATGLHRTRSEIERHDSFAESLGGCRLTANSRWGSVGLTGLVSWYSRAIIPQDIDRYRYAFSGKRNWVSGLDWNVFWKNLHWSGEAAVCRSKGTAILSAFYGEWNRMDVVVSSRHFNADFQNPHAADEPQNETGWTVGFKTKTSRHSTFSLAFDLFHKPWRTYFIPLPTRGENLQVRFDRTVPRFFAISMKARIQLSEKMDAGRTESGKPLEMLRERLERQVRVDIRTAHVHGFLLKAACGFVYVHYPESPPPVLASLKTETGFLLLADIRYQYSRTFEAAARWSFFKTDSYDSGLYAYENDLPGVFYVPPCYGEGTRGYALVQWNPRKKLGLSVKYGRTIRYGVTFLGSGSESVPGNVEDTFGFQVDWML